MAIVAYIGLGSNLEQPEHQVLSAIEEIAAIPDTILTETSRLYRSAPVGPGDQDDYINAVVEIETTLPPLVLLDALQGIEAKHNRKRIIRWGARTLDLDILLYGNENIISDRLTIPHKEMHWRNFVLMPLADIKPLLKLPTGESLQTLLLKAGSEGLTACGEITLPEPQ